MTMILVLVRREWMPSKEGEGTNAASKLNIAFTVFNE
jgi:hypothetical protein